VFDALGPAARAADGNANNELARNDRRDTFGLLSLIRFIYKPLFLIIEILHRGEASFRLIVEAD
jgi:hypothetical protein